MVFRNYYLGIFGHVNSTSEFGFLFENFVFLLLRTQTTLGSTKLNFWRTKDKADVDFILESGKKITPIEVKFKSFKKEEVPRSLRNFIAKYNPSEAYIINLNFKKTLRIDKTTLFFLPFYELLFKEF